MFKRLILAALVLGVSLVLFSDVNPDTLPEKYVPKVIIDAEFVTEKNIPEGIKTPEELKEYVRRPGVFNGLNMDYDGPVPKDMEIDKDGNIYIFDPENNRIQKFDKDGRYLKSIPVPDCWLMDDNSMALEHYKDEFTIDDEGNIYVLDSGVGDIEGWKKGIGLVNKRGEVIIDTAWAYVYRNSVEVIEIDQRGKEIKRILLPWEIDGKKVDYNESKLERDEEGEVVIEVGSYGKKNILKIKEERGKKIAVGLFDSRKAKDDIRYIAAQGYNPKGFVKSISRKKKELRMGDRKIKITDASRILGIKVLGKDKWGNIFVEVSAWKGFKIKKYSPVGILLAAIQVSPSPYWSKYTYKRMIDSSGNYYELQVKDHKLRVVKWERRGK